MDLKLGANFSYRVAILRKCLSLANIFSTRCRNLYKKRSKSGLGFLAFALLGMIGIMPLLDHWKRLQEINKVEFFLALRFGLEYDINKMGEGMIHKLSFNTMMYIKFQQYVRKHALQDATKLVMQFENSAFSLRLKVPPFGLMDVFKSLGVKNNLKLPEAISNIRQLAENGYSPLYVKLTKATKHAKRHF